MWSEELLGNDTRSKSRQMNKLVVGISSCLFINIDVLSVFRARKYFFSAENPFP